MTTTGREEGAPKQTPDSAKRRRRAYEAPRLIVYGRVKDLTAGLKMGTSDLGGLTAVLLSNLV
jgi:hypothetical protein